MSNKISGVGEVLKDLMRESRTDHDSRIKMDDPKRQHTSRWMEFGWVWNDFGILVSLKTTSRDNEIHRDRL